MRIHSFFSAVLVVLMILATAPAFAEVQNAEYVAEWGDGYTHIARRCVHDYRARLDDQPMSPAQLIWAEDYVQDRLGDGWLELGQTVACDTSLAADAVRHARSLTDNQQNDLQRHVAKLSPTTLAAINDFDDIYASAYITNDADEPATPATTDEPVQQAPATSSDTEPAASTGRAETEPRSTAAASVGTNTAEPEADAAVASTTPSSQETDEAGAAASASQSDVPADAAESAAFAWPSAGDALALLAWPVIVLFVLPAALLVVFIAFTIAVLGAAAVQKEWLWSRKKREVRGDDKNVMLNEDRGTWKELADAWKQRGGPGYDRSADVTAARYEELAERRLQRLAGAVSGFWKHIGRAVRRNYMRHRYARRYSRPKAEGRASRALRRVMRRANQNILRVLHGRRRSRRRHHRRRRSEPIVIDEAESDVAINNDLLEEVRRSGRERRDAEVGGEGDDGVIGSEYEPGEDTQDRISRAAREGVDNIVRLRGEEDGDNEDEGDGERCRDWGS